MRPRRKKAVARQKQFKVLRGHVKGCMSMSGVMRAAHETPWSYNSTRIQLRDISGRLTKHASIEWLVFPCMDFSCKAELAMNPFAFIEEYAPHDD